jgi:hypothetical protein
MKIANIKKHFMEDDVNRFEKLFERLADYGKTSIELAKLTAVRETTNIVSSWVPHAIVLVFVASCLMFITVGLALWIGEAVENIYYGFFIVAGFYGIMAFVLHFFFRNWIKKAFRQFFINQILN